MADLRVDVGRQCVFRGHADVALPNLSFRLLVALIQSAPNVLSNDRLMELVWPGQVVSPETVNKRVKLLRDALGDDEREPRYIAGVRSRGYRLIAPVQTAPPAEIVPAAAQVDSLDAAESKDGQPEIPLQPAAHALSRKRRWLQWSAAAVTIVVAAALAVRWDVSRHPPVRDSSAIAAKKIVVAVLPFENLSAESADAYLALGVPEMIISRMSQSPSLSVIARGSSFALTSKSLGSREIGGRLNAAFLVGGSIQRDADRLRLDVQLMDAAANTVVWSARFDRKLRDIFEIEDEIGDQVADALVIRSGAAKPKPLAKERSGNVEAYLAFLPAVEFAPGGTLISKETHRR